MNKIQKPLFKKVHKHSKGDEQQHNCGCTHNHSKEELYGEVQEVPAVFSYSTSFEFDKDVKGYELQTCLVDCLEDLKQWVVQNKHFIGHIKIFAESGKNFSIWLSTTGKKINIKTSEDNQDDNIKNIIINMTAIVFGTDEQTLRSVTLENLKKRLPHHSE